MSSFDDRERAEEARYALDQETQFKVVARRNKLLGLWAAELMGLDAATAEAYAKTVVIADLEEAGDADVIRKVLADFGAAGVTQTEAAIEEQLARLTPVAREQVMNDIKG
ncbi:MAG: DUF1476 domain-containing protein [Hyphomonas sp.]|uniref:DUF1476 domain-containing protein n=1 Tax=Hyphomonas sp. TaxID=87 RepID=UPI001802ABAF|nr:DUF1476 domain-containing protein [Hyphomonas sp.]MBA3068033.1 DUF1476 domain-containing protein [Hyphomonas sp.]MBU3921019.1 DUF1476 domain-containing protein [Alphaproteobacteria bacterium]MBU4061372.1 DUF1476 domain-containing protein [Alphaproteobacteria bacterium]MBU4162625.1 DUF1476 domain-containing protein [Alphaproteobacteria bacterium]